MDLPIWCIQLSGEHATHCCPSTHTFPWLGMLQMLPRNAKSAAAANARIAKQAADHRQPWLFKADSKQQPAPLPDYKALYASAEQRAAAAEQQLQAKEAQRNQAQHEHTAAEQELQARDAQLYQAGQECAAAEQQLQACKARLEQAEQQRAAAEQQVQAQHAQLVLAEQDHAAAKQQAADSETQLQAAQQQVLEEENKCINFILPFILLI